MKWLFILSLLAVFVLPIQAADPCPRNDRFQEAAERHHDAGMRRLERVIDSQTKWQRFEERMSERRRELFVR